MAEKENVKKYKDRASKSKEEADRLKLSLTAKDEELSDLKESSQKKRLLTRPWS